MRTKKAIAVLLAVVMLAVPLAVVSLAAPSGEITITAGPTKTEYTDFEYFNPQGLSVSVDGTTVDYSPLNADFTFLPALNEYLKVENEEVEVYYQNKYVGSVEITVNHLLGEITEMGEAGHGQYCLGCGAVFNFEAHDIPEFIPNDDGGLFLPQTQTGTCSVCDAKVTENIEGSEGFLYIFDLDNTTETEASIIEYLYLILVTLVQTLVGIR